MYWLYRFKWWLADHTPYLPRAPINLDLELAGKCNLACTMCPYGTGSFHEGLQGMMPTKMAIKALTEAQKIGVKAIKFNFRGEPGLHKQLIPLIQLAKRMGFIDVFINTNMLAFSEKRIKELAESNIDKLIISIDGNDKESYEEIRVGGDYDKLIRNINLFHKYNKKVKVIIQTVADHPIEHEVKADEYRFVKVQDRGQGAEGNTGERKRCPQPRQRLVIAWDGQIFGCCSNWNNEFSLGNYSETSLKQAWKGERMKLLRQISTKCDNWPCKDCQVGGSYK